MADDKAKATEKQPAPASAEAAPAKKGGPPVKLLGIVAGLMIAEAAGVFMVAKMTGPAKVEAAPLAKGDGHDQEATVEISLVDDRFQNMQTGRVWLWDTEIVLKVKAKNEEYVNKVLESRAAEIKEGVALVFRRAQHNQLKEAGLETLNRQLSAYLDDVVGKDADGKERIERVVIPKCKGFPAE